MTENNILAYKIFYAIFIFSMLVFLCSCKKMIEVEPPRNQVISATAFADDQTALSTLAGLYSQMMSSNQSLANGGLSIYAGLAADEIYNTSPSSVYDPYTLNALTASLSNINSAFWSSAYLNIYHVNAILEGMNASASLSQGTKNQVAGEAKFIRSFYYFYLVNLFGEVPLVPGTDYKSNAILPRTAVPDINAAIIKDLQEAAVLLPSSYSGTGKVRPNKWAVKSFLARIYLFNKEWSKAEKESSEVINSGTYSLTALNNVFLANSAEAIWQLMPVGTSFNTSEGNAFVASSPSVVPQFAVTSSLLNAFETADARKASWLKSNTVSGQQYFYPNKYKVKTGGAPYTEYNMVLRLAEQYLIRAEALVQQDRIDEAKTELNKIRNRAGLTGTNAANKAALLSAIENERRIEFFSEWGHRWLDLKRTGRVDAVLGALKAGWKTSSALFPIPLTELQRNVFLTQNPGY